MLLDCSGGHKALRTREHSVPVDCCLAGLRLRILVLIRSWSLDGYGEEGIGYVCRMRCLLQVILWVSYHESNTHCNPESARWINNRRYAEECTANVCFTLPAESSPEDSTPSPGINYCYIRVLPPVLRQCHVSHSEPFPVRAGRGATLADLRVMAGCVWVFTAVQPPESCLKNPEKQKGFLKVIIDLKFMESHWKSRWTLPKMCSSDSTQ